MTAVSIRFWRRVELPPPAARIAIYPEHRELDVLRREERSRKRRGPTGSSSDPHQGENRFLSLSGGGVPLALLQSRPSRQHLGFQGRARLSDLETASQVFSTPGPRRRVRPFAQSVRQMVHSGTHHQRVPCQSIEKRVPRLCQPCRRGKTCWPIALRRHGGGTPIQLFNGLSGVSTCPT